MTTQLRSNERFQEINIFYISRIAILLEKSFVSMFHDRQNVAHPHVTFTCHRFSGQAMGNIMMQKKVSISFFHQQMSIKIEIYMKICIYIYIEKIKVDINTSHMSEH